jgi:hypothetical protein
MASRRSQFVRLDQMTIVEKSARGLPEPKLRLEVRLRRCAATARHPSPVRCSLAYRAEARPKGERRMVDLTGIEPVTS